MNWNRREEAILTECVKYGYGCNPVHVPRHWHISELFASERQKRERLGNRGEKKTFDIKLEIYKSRLKPICKGHHLQITHSTNPGLRDQFMLLRQLLGNTTLREEETQRLICPIERKTSLPFFPPVNLLSLCSQSVSFLFFHSVSLLAYSCSTLVNPSKLDVFRHSSHTQPVVFEPKIVIL